MRMMKSSLPHLGEVTLSGAGYIDLAVLWRKLVQKHQFVFPYTGERQASDVIQSGVTVPPTFRSSFFPPPSALKGEATVSSASLKPTCQTTQNAVITIYYVNPLSPELNPICYLLALLANDFLHVSRIRVK
jgi:transposase